MATVQYSVLDIMKQGKLGDTKLVNAGITSYIDLRGLTYLDAVHGFTFKVVGTRYGANDVTLRLQQSLSPKDPDAVWTDLGAAVTNFGTAGQGTQAVPVAATAQIQIVPAATAVLLPAIRLKVVGGVASGATFTEIYRTIMGE